MQPWNKSINLIQKAEDFYRKALWSLFNIKIAQSHNDYNLAESFTMPDDDDAPFSGRPNVDLIAQSEDFDIKDEELFNQFETFMKGYGDFVDSLSVDPKHLNLEAMENIGQLLDTLKTRSDRLINNPYLNMNNTDGWGEDFNPGDFTAFILRVVSDANNQLDAVAGQKVNLSEMQAAQYANQFQTIQDEKVDDKKEEWSANKIQKALEARQRYVAGLQEARKVGPSHPKWNMYVNYITNRREQYQDIISDPVKKLEYRKKAGERHTKYRAFEERREDLIQQIERTRDKDDLEKLKNQLVNLDKTQKSYKARELKNVRNIQNRRGPDNVSRRIEESGDLDSLVLKLTGNIANVKMGIKKEITATLLMQERTLFQPYLDKIAAAEAAGNAVAIKLANAALQKAMNAYANSNPRLVEYDKNSEQFYQLRDMLKVAHKQKWFESEAEEVKLQIKRIIDFVKQLMLIPERTFSIPNRTTKIILENILKLLLNRMST